MEWIYYHFLYFTPFCGKVHFWINARHSIEWKILLIKIFLSGFHYFYYFVETPASAPWRQFRWRCVVWALSTSSPGTSWRTSWSPTSGEGRSRALFHIISLLLLLQRTCWVSGEECHQDVSGKFFFTWTPRSAGSPTSTADWFFQKELIK